MKGWDNGTLFMSGRFLPPGGLRPGTVRSAGQCFNYWATAAPNKSVWHGSLLTTTMYSNIKHLIRLCWIRLHASDELGRHSPSAFKLPDFSLIFPDIIQFSIPLYGSRSWVYSFLYWVQTFISWKLDYSWWKEYAPSEQILSFKSSLPMRRKFAWTSH